MAWLTSTDRLVMSAELFKQTAAADFRGIKIYPIRTSFRMLSKHILKSWGRVDEDQVLKPEMQ